MNNPLSQLALDYWYKVILAAGTFVFLLNGAGLLPAYPTATTACISAGFFFWGLGEWINHPYQERLVLDAFDRVEAKISGRPRKANTLGSIFDIAGFILMGAGIIKLF
jgi:hypothetical protein